MLNPVHLRTVESVCRTGSFAETARELGYTSSAISQQVQSLERSIGAALFEREAQAVRPTRLALQIVEVSRSIVTELASLSEQIGTMLHGTRGRFSIGTFSTASTGIVANTVRELTADREDLAVSVIEGEPLEILPLISDGTIDVGLVYEYGLAPRIWPQDVVAHEIATEPLYLLLPRKGIKSPNFLAAVSAAAARPKGEEALRELRGAPWISSARDTAGADALDRMCAAAGFAPKVTLRANNYDVVQRFVASGLGVAVVPHLGLRDREGVRAIPLTINRAFRRIFVVYRSTTTDPLIAVATSCIERQVESMPTAPVES